MIDEQKLLQWIEDKRYVYTVENYDHAAADDSAEEVAFDKGCLKMLSMLGMAVSSGELLRVDNGEEVKG